MKFVWFWTFWHWSRESYREGSLLRSPLHGIGSHWDEWFRHEAAENDLRLIEAAGRSERNQRRFLTWFFRHWARETGAVGRRMAPFFVLSQLAPLPPFREWALLRKYREGYGVGGISAIVLGEGSQGTQEDVRQVEAVLLPEDRESQTIASEGFTAEAAHLELARTAAKDVLKGRGMLLLLGIWSLGGARPYPAWLKAGLWVGWGTVAGLILFLLFGPDPGGGLFWTCAALAGLWGCLVLIAVGTAITQGLRAWSTGKHLCGLLERSHLRLRMNGGLTLQGGSGGLPFTLNILRALCQAQPGALRRSWIWQRFFRGARLQGAAWAATGSITTGGWIKSVVLGPKLRACMAHDRIRHILTPRQRDASQAQVDRLASDALAMQNKPAPLPGAARPRLGFAAESPPLHISRCRHLAQAVLALGRVADSRQIAANIFAAVVSITMVMALPDLRSILLPHPAPTAVAPASSSPYELWVSLDTKHPDYFRAVLESDYWSNRRVDVKRHGGVTPSVRAEIPFHRLTGMTAADENHGSVWIERRLRFLAREYNPGERVGRYSISYLTRLGHE